MDCLVCTRIAQWEEGKNPYFIFEFKNSIFVVGDHQFDNGYSLLLLKDHVRELHEMPEEQYVELGRELMLATRAIQMTFKPWKMNHSSLGNGEEHVHWHITPRYETDRNHRKNPYVNRDKWDSFVIDAEEAARIAATIRANVQS